jgi:hypothetical protein
LSNTFSGLNLNLSCCQRYSSSLVYRPSLISGHLRSWLLCQLFLSDGQEDGGSDDEKGVRKCQSRDPLDSKMRTEERLRNSPSRLEPTQSTDTNNYGLTYMQDGKGTVNYSNNGVDVREYFPEKSIQQHIVDTFMNEKFLQCGIYEITWKEI